MKTISIPVNPDFIGMAASTLCLIHCISTPFIFLAKACTVSATCCADAPIWWRLIDYVFIAVSFAAIYFATKNSTKNWVKIALWAAWFALVLVVVVETIGANLLPAQVVYIPAFVIIALHFYNQKYCRCGGDDCRTDSIMISNELR